MEEDKDFLQGNMELMKFADCLAVIMDRSEIGLDALQSATRDFPELEKMNLLGDELKWEFLVFLKSKRDGEAMVVYAKTRDSLEGTLEIVGSKVRELGNRFCAYLPAVSEETMPYVMEIVARMQRTGGDKES